MAKSGSITPKWPFKPQFLSILAHFDHFSLIFCWNRGKRPFFDSAIFARIWLKLVRNRFSRGFLRQKSPKSSQNDPRLAKNQSLLKMTLFFWQKSQKIHFYWFYAFFFANFLHKNLIFWCFFWPFLAHFWIILYKK